MGDRRRSFTTNRRRKRYNSERSATEVATLEQKRSYSEQQAEGLISGYISQHHGEDSCRPAEAGRISEADNTNATSATTTTEGDIDSNIRRICHANDACLTNTTAFSAGVSSSQFQLDYQSPSTAVPLPTHPNPCIPGPPPLKSQKAQQSHPFNSQQFPHTLEMNPGSGSAMVDAMWDDGNGHRLHHHHHHHLHHLPDSPGLGGKPRCSANARERDRTHSVNTAFLTLRTLIPTGKECYIVLHPARYYITSKFCVLYVYKNVCISGYAKFLLWQATDKG